MNYFPGKGFQIQMLLNAQILRSNLFVEFPQCEDCEQLWHFLLAFNAAIYNGIVVKQCRKCDNYHAKMEDFMVRNGYATKQEGKP